MEVKPDTPDLEPANDDESHLVGMMFERITVLFPDWKMGERTDLAMSMLAVVKRWAHNLDETSESTRTTYLDE